MGRTDEPQPQPTYLIAFWKPAKGGPETVYEDVQSESQKKAESDAKRIAQYRGWRVVAVDEKTPELIEGIRKDKQLAYEQQQAQQQGKPMPTSPNNEVVLQSNAFHNSAIGKAGDIKNP